MDLKSICTGVSAIARRTGEFISKESANFDIDDARQKGKHDFVSYVDIEAEKRLSTELSALLPQAGFIAEEGTAIKGESTLIWIIDPLDGTTNFMHGAPVYSISIALADNDEILLGVILDVPSGELFHAYREGGAWLNGKSIEVSGAKTLDDSLIATGFPYKDYENLDRYMACLEFFIRRTHGVRRMGSAAIDLAWVACGRYDGFFEAGLNRWDVAAGIILIKEAGGLVSDFSGKIKNTDGSEIVAANDKIFETLRHEVEKYMKQA
ncbi:MAG: inositol monophosphatase family protein [Bacteroidales bacterium]|nr:inositol monophosphatase family protein [Bacteroidales bacterium]